MNEVASQFVGSIPENYDGGLGPSIFHDYGEDLAGRAGATGCVRLAPRLIAQRRDLIRNEHSRSAFWEENRGGSHQPGGRSG